jgi:hypothetical protein
MTPENARRAANVILTAACATLVLGVWRAPRLRRALIRLAPVAAGHIRPVHIAAAVAAFARPPAPPPSSPPPRSGLS